MPKYSIIFPVYNVEPYVEKSLKSILEQTFEDFELLCVDDCSQDKSMEIVNRYAESDSRIRILTHKCNQGLGAARNTALNQAGGKYIACVDSDDYIEPEFLEKVNSAFLLTSAKCVWIGHSVYDEKSNYTYKVQIKRETGEYELSPNQIFNQAPYAWNKVYIKALIEDNNFKWAEGVFYEDIYFYLNYFIKYNKIYYIQDSLYTYRKRKDSITSKWTEQKIEDLFDVLNETYNKIVENGYDPVFQSELQMYAKRFYFELKNTQHKEFTETKYQKLCNRFLQ